MKNILWLAILLPFVAQAQGPADQQVFVLCTATLTYKASIEARTGKGPKYHMYTNAAGAYYVRVYSKWRPAVTQVIGQIHSGQLKMSDVNGTAANCLRWYQNDEIKDIK